MEIVEVIRDELVPELRLYKLKINSRYIFALDIYQPSPVPSSLEELIAYESALGYRLRVLSSFEDENYIAPRSFNNGDIKRIIHKNFAEIKKTEAPILLGFIYDSMPPVECSQKDLISVLKDLTCGLKWSAVISTAYTPNHELRDLAESTGKIRLELRIPMLSGVFGPNEAEVAHIIKRWSIYGHSLIYLRFGPVCEGPDGTIFTNVSRYLNHNLRSPGVDIGHMIGMKILFPGAPLVPQEYIDLLTKTNASIYPNVNIDGSYTRDANAILMSVWKDGWGPEIWGAPVEKEQTQAMIGKLSERCIQKSHNFGGKFSDHTSGVLASAECVDVVNESTDQLLVQ